MLRHGRLLAFLSGEEPMAHYDFAASPFRFSRGSADWRDLPTCAAVNSFADGGTNAHVVLDRWSDARPAKRAPVPPPQLSRIDLDEMRVPDLGCVDPAELALSTANFWGCVTRPA